MSINARLLSCNKIWDSAPHSAFTDLIRYRGQLLCAFREGDSHVSKRGTIRVLKQAGDTWQSISILHHAEGDLRDAKLSQSPGGRLILCCALATIDHPTVHHRTLVYESADGVSWSEPRQIGLANDWLWRITWHQQLGFVVGYLTMGKRTIRLYQSVDQRTFEPHAELAVDNQYPNEATLRLANDDEMICLLRAEKPSQSFLGQSKRPFRDWSWHTLGDQVGGPNLIRTRDGTCLAAGRRSVQRGKPLTALWQLDLARKQLNHLLDLPSGGDCSYPGMVVEGDQLLMSYYSSHEGKASIYAARIKLT